MRALVRGALVFLLVAPFARTALAAEAVAPPPAIISSPVYDWAGAYIGGHVGYGRGNGHATIRDLETSNVSHAFGGQFGGVQVGYNFILPSRLLFGVEADVTFQNFYDADHILWSTVVPGNGLDERLDFIATLRGRVGYLFGPWMLYGTGGFAVASSHFFEYPADTDRRFWVTRRRDGWSAGAGVEYAFQANWTARLEYLYSAFGSAGTAFAAGPQVQSGLDFYELRAGLSRKIDWSGRQTAGGPGATPIDPIPIEWEIHGQSTYIHQGYPSFGALYTGTNSLGPHSQTKETWTSSAYLTVRLWDGGELHYNPELLQGFGLSDTTGLAGFSNGEAQKSDFPYPHYNTSRLFIRQTLGLGGEQETVESDYGLMSGKRDISRLTFQVGKFAVHDVFDNNSYAQDPRIDFLNWSIWAAGAFDYAADRVGLTWGAVGELNQPLWALRGGYFLIGDEPNSNNFDPKVFQRGMYVGELETRYSLFARSGKLRVNGWFYDAFSGSFRQAVNFVLVDPSLNPNFAIISTRAGHIKYGYGVNLEQSITDDVGLFGRWSWNSNTYEMSAFTDINASLSGGVSIKGASWGRPQDVVGLAGAANGISKDYRDYLAIGGLGILVGDGALNYRTEKVFEAYYAVFLAKGTTLTFDYQFVKDPAYNADRGPVSIFAGRLHASF